MRTKVTFLATAAVCLTAAICLAGNPQGPGTTPENTLTYTLEDLYNRLISGTAGTKSSFFEPSAGRRPAPGIRLMK